MARPKSNKPRRVKANITVDADLWERCKAISDQDPFFNWSLIAETAFRQVLMLRDLVFEASSDGKDVQGMTDAMLLKFQSIYYETLSDTYENISQYKLKSSVTESESTK